eukprot:jgi/Chrpa1/21463/Chrysochromulina_OHIO_Genome00023037-RA
MMAKLAGASSFTLLETMDTWPLFRRSPVKAKLITEATFDCILDARADRCGLLADRLGAGLLERVLPGEAQLDRLREYRPQKGCWEWWCQTHAHYALTALSGGADRLGPLERHAALRFLLGLPDAPRSQQIVESPEAARTLALGYGRGFLKWIVAILAEGRKAACTARSGTSTKVNAVRTTAVSYRDRVVIIDQPAPRTKWMASRGLQEVWEGACLVRRCFRALRLWATMVGIAVLDRTRQPLTEPDRYGGREAGEWAYDNWESELSVFTAFYTLAQHAQANTALDIAGADSCGCGLLDLTPPSPVGSRHEWMLGDKPQSTLDCVDWLLARLGRMPARLGGSERARLARPRRISRRPLALLPLRCSGSDAPVVTSSYPPQSAAGEAAFSPNAMDLVGCGYGRAPYGGCAKATVAISTSASNAWVRTIRGT